MNEIPIDVDCREVQRLQSTGADFMLLDCRDPDEHVVVHITGATLIPMKELPGRIGELGANKDRRIVVHCHHGGRSLRVANWLRGQGFTQAQSMAGGVDAWRKRSIRRSARY